VSSSACRVCITLCIECAACAAARQAGSTCGGSGGGRVHKAVRVHEAGRKLTESGREGRAKQAWYMRQIACMWSSKGRVCEESKSTDDPTGNHAPSCCCCCCCCCRCHHGAAGASFGGWRAQDAPKTECAVKGLALAASKQQHPSAGTGTHAPGTPSVQYVALTCTFSISARSAEMQCSIVMRAPPHPGTDPSLQPSSSSSRALSATRALYSGRCNQQGHRQREGAVLQASAEATLAASGHLSTGRSPKTAHEASKGRPNIRSVCSKLSSHALHNKCTTKVQAHMVYKVVCLMRTDCGRVREHAAAPSCRQVLRTTSAHCPKSKRKSAPRLRQRVLMACLSRGHRSIHVAARDASRHHPRT